MNAHNIINRLKIRSILHYVKRKLNRCDHCWQEGKYKFSLPDLINGKEEDLFYYYCWEHALDSGFCCGCGGFCAGIESFDMSEIRGFCSQCVDEIKCELGEYDGDIDDYPELEMEASC